MKTIFFISLLTLSMGSFAQGLSCMDKLLPSGRFSGAHLLAKTEWNDPGKEALDQESALTAFHALINNKLLCSHNEVTIKIHPTCQTFQPDIPKSTVCYLFTNIGYFFISRDMGRNVNFTFSRDKRFQEPESRKKSTALLKTSTILN